MLNRWLGIMFGFGMLLANAEIVRRDVLSDWLVGDPPPNRSLTLAPGQERRTQVGIYDGRGRSLGKSWTRARKTSADTGDNIVSVTTTTVLAPLALPGEMSTPPVRIETSVIYRHNEPLVDSLDFKMFGLGIPISLRAEAVGAGDFPFTWQVGHQKGQVALNSRTPRALGDVIRPFDELPELYVGRKWRINLLDAVSQLLPKLGGSEIELERIIIEVTGKEVIEHGGERIETFVVEGGGAKAWVAQDGRVLRQAVRLPVLGELVLLDEPYDDQSRSDAVRGVPDSTFGRSMLLNEEAPPAPARVVRSRGAPTSERTDPSSGDARTR